MAKRHDRGDGHHCAHCPGASGRMHAGTECRFYDNEGCDACDPCPACNGSGRGRRYMIAETETVVSTRDETRVTILCPHCRGQSPDREVMDAQLKRDGDTSGACSVCNNTHEVAAEQPDAALARQEASLTKCLAELTAKVDGLAETVRRSGQKAADPSRENIISLFNIAEDAIAAHINGVADDAYVCVSQIRKLTAKGNRDFRGMTNLCNYMLRIAESRVLKPSARNHVKDCVMQIFTRLAEIGEKHL